MGMIFFLIVGLLFSLPLYLLSYKLNSCVILVLKILWICY